MKNLKEIIEGLKVNSKSKVHQNALIIDDDILNINIESLDELRDVMEKYFEKVAGQSKRLFGEVNASRFCKCKMENTIWG